MLLKDCSKNQPSFIANEIYQQSDDFVKSPFRYPGGKFYALKFIIPFINCVPHDEYREPFVGGGSIFFAKQKSKINWINDLEGNLITTYQAIADKKNNFELCSLLSQEIATPTRHKEVKDYAPSSLLDIAFRTFYLNRTSYSGIIHKPAWGYKEGKSSPPKNWTQFVQAAGKKLENVKITNLDFEQVITAKKDGKLVLMYLDPPYFHADQKRAYKKSFSQEDHFRLAKILKNSEHLFCLSYDDCEEIRNLYSWAKIYQREWLYNTANKKGTKRQKGNELIITNYQVKFNNHNQLKLFDL
jgi:DNA adenine methylase